MANSRELAEQAFSLLQDALKNSESRAAELDAELRKKRVPRNQVEKQVQVLAHRLQKVEAEREQWQREADRLEEVLESERVKVQQLKKKLQVVESGPDRVEKREVNYWRSRVEQFDETSRQYKKRIAELKSSLKAHLEAPETTTMDPAELQQLQTELERAEAERTELLSRIGERDAAALALNAEVTQLRTELESRETAAQALVTQAEEFQAQIGELTARAEQRDAEINELRNQVEALGHTLGKRDTEAGELRQHLDARNGEAHDLRSQLEQRDGEAHDLRNQIQQREGEANDLRSQLEQRDAEANDLRNQLEQREAEANDLRNQLAQRDTLQSALQAEIDALKTQAAGHDAALAERDARIAELAESDARIEQADEALRQQIAALEEELSEEKECAVNLGEIANERGEQITELTEKLDEAEERYADAKWHLGRAERFERLVVKRRKLIDSLIAGHRAKQKSNTALKAGLDGLRNYKARAEQQAQKLLMRVEELTSELRAAEERLKSDSSSSQSEEKLKRAAEKISALEDRVSAQGELLEGLEGELAAAKASRQSSPVHTKEFAEVKAELDAKSVKVEKLEAELQAQKEILSRLRASESETMRLQVVQENDQSLIERLKLQVDALKAELSLSQQKDEAPPSSNGQAPAADLRQKDAQLADLKRALRDKEKEIARLSETAAGWQKKYEFLSAEPPSAYSSAEK